MNTSRRFGLFGRSSGNDRTSKAIRSNRAARLAALSGGATGAHGLEQLEARQLLFTLTITPGDVNAATGLGTKTIDFPYAVPFYAATIPAATAPLLVNENFDDEMANWTTGVPAVPPNGTFFAGSNIQISYTSNSGTPAQLIRRGGQQPDQALRVALTGTDQMTFTFFDPAGQNVPNPVPLLARRANVVISNNSAPLPNDGGGLNVDGVSGTRLELLNNGVVVQTYLGAALAALSNAVVNGTQFAINFPAGFDAFRFRSAADAPNNTNYADNFVIESINAELAPGRFAQFVNDRMFAARLTFTGPVGASVNVVDLYGRDMLTNLNLIGTGNGNGPAPNDRNDDGVPDNNIGIGRVTIAGTNDRSSLTMYGARRDNNGNIAVTNSPIGYNADLTTLGFGFYIVPTQGTDPVVAGLPPVGTSVLIGSPFVPDLNNYFAPRGALTADDFNRADQGVFVTGGASMGSILINGAMFGSSKVDGALARWSVGFQAGSLRVDGDLGTFTSQTDAGVFFVFGGQSPNGGDPLFLTNARLNVGRTLRAADIGGRNFMNTSVLADVNNPARARLVQNEFISRERAYGIDPAQPGADFATINANLNSGAVWFQAGQAVPFGTGFFNNNSIANAEFVGYNGTAVVIHGAINGADIFTGADSTDVYSFPADPAREVVIAVGVNGALPAYVRIVDRNGLTIAALDDGGAGRGATGNNNSSRIIRFRPDHADVYYLVLNSDVQATIQPGGNYAITVSGMAPVTLGSFRSVGGWAGNSSQATISLSSGAAGTIRIGTGIGNLREDSDESEVFATVFTTFTTTTLERYLGWGATTINIPGDLFNLYTGSTIYGGVGPANSTLLVRGSLGTFVTGNNLYLNPTNNGAFTGGNTLTGDVINLDLRVGGSIGVFHARGALADQPSRPPTPSGSPSATGAGTFVNIQTGTVSGQRGDIGRLLVGNYLNGRGTTIHTSPGSTIDQFSIGDDPAGLGEIVFGDPDINVGAGSDIRFFSLTGRRRSAFDQDIVTTFGYGQSLNFVDDAGATISIALTGGNEPVDPNNDPRQQSSIQVRYLPINGSRGVAIGRINVVLRGGANLVITGLTPGVATLGRIFVDSVNADGGQAPATPAPNSNIIFAGSAEIDVLRIDQTAGILDSIQNNTVGGDIIAIDALALRTLTIEGNLGRAQLSSASGALIGPFMDISATTAGVGGPFFMKPTSIDIQESTNWFVAGIYAPVTNPGVLAPTEPRWYLEDVGSPIDPYLNGVVVRTGDLENVTVKGSVGDVIVQAGHLINLVANSDGITPQGQFQGIEGNIYAVAIGTVDVGDGLAGTGQNPFAQASIVADQAIVRIIIGGGRIQGATDRGIIMAAGVGGPLTTLGTTVATPTQLPAPIDGIGRVEATNGRYDAALIYSGPLDDWWHSLRATDIEIRTADIDVVQGTNSDLFRSEVWARTLNAVTITGAAFDATFVNVTNTIGAITADEFRNSTRLGQAQEYYRNRIVATNNIGTIATNGLNGDISDLTVDVGGNITNRIAALNIQRTNISVDNFTASVFAASDVRSVSIETGRLGALSAGQNIRSTALRVAGPVESVTAGNEITQLSVNSSGPDGRVDLVRAQNLLNADITSSGSIGAIESVNSDVVGSIVTRNDDVRANNGGLTTLRAGRDLIVGLSILGDTGTITAARNIGAFGVLNPDLDLRGNLGSISAAGGQIYSDLLVGQNITGTVTIGRVSMKPGNDLTATSDILAFGRINAIVINNDFNGNITSRSGGIGSITFNSGSFRPNHAITVNNGDLTLLALNGGDLLGSVYVDGNIGGIEVKNGPDGFKGQIGIASWRRNFKPIPTDPLRNELPPGVQRSPGIDGVTIRAGGSIDHITVQQGSFTESQIIAGTTIGAIDIALQLRNDSLNVGLNNAIIAGDAIGTVRVGGFVGAVAILAGVIDLGTDGRVGGVGSAADTVKSGSIGSVTLNTNGVAKSVNSVVAAGVSPDSNGRYNTAGATFANGRSSIDSVSANRIINVFANAAGSLGATSAGITRGTNLPPTDPATLATDSPVTEVELAGGVGFLFQLPSGFRGVATLSGPGRAFYDPAQGRIRLANTTTASSLTIVPNGSFLDGLRVLGNANTALGTLSIGGTLRGASTVFINGDVTTFTLGGVDALGGLFGSGGNINSLTTGGFLAGTLRARVVGSLTVNGDLGRAAVNADAFVDFLNVTTVNVTGTVAGALSSDRGFSAVTAGSVNNGGIRSGLSIGTVTVGSLTDGRISARNSITSVVVNGDSNGSQILGGADLGHDADFGGAGRDADALGSGSLASVRINGNFKKSDIGAGVLRGASGYLGGTDVSTAAGRSSIGSVVVTGTQVGSSLNSEQYRILSTGTIGSVTVAGVPFTGAANFQVERIAAVAVPVRVTDLFVTESSRIFIASIVFNQAIDVSTLSAALSVVEVRNGGATTIGLAEGSDYTIQYDRVKNTAKIFFSRSVTERNLPQTPGLPGPGVYQIILSAQVLRGSTQDSLLDGNGDGQPGDDFARNVVVGDAGDKITAGNPVSAPSVNFYGPTDLDLVLRKFANIGSLPDTNTVFTIGGSIGDHPDTDPDLFRLGGDVDVYRITLRAGQILRMGAITGSALGAARAVFSSAGTALAANSVAGPVGGAPGSAVVRLPNNVTLDTATTSEDQYLITQTGTYFIVIAGSLNNLNIGDTNAILNSDPVAGAFGLYAFDIQIFDDGNTGFVGDTNAGTSAPLVTPPVPLVFAGVDGTFGTGDDLKAFVVGDWTFRLTGNGGPASVVTGTNSQGWTVTRTAAPNGTFGSANDRISTTIRSSIGLPGATGTPDEVSPDVDIFSLNNGLPLTPGTKIRATFRLTQTGSNIGLSPELINRNVRSGISLGQNLLGHAQFALFETPVGTGFNNAKLVAAPSDFLPIGGQAAKTLTDGRNTYGYDAQGDFFMEFIVPGAQGISSPVPASYSLYLQGAIRSDYTLEIVQQGTGSTTLAPQNVFLETNGGLIDWLEAGAGVTTSLSAFSSSVVGFTGQIGGQPVDTYVLNNLVASLNAVFVAANVNIVISTNPNDFARQDFSTVFLAGNVEPNAFFGNGSFGASQKVDFFNVDKNDQAVVFIPSLADIGFEPTTAGADRFVSALTGAVARRIGELVGLRLETAVAGAASPVPVMASDSVAQAANSPVGFNNVVRNLAGLADNAADTVFYLGTQNAGSLIRQVVIQR